jgi:hypothetical protein
MLVLPNGQVLYNDGTSQMLVYTAGGTAKPLWAPSIDSVSDNSLAQEAPTACPASSSPGWIKEPSTVTTSRTTRTSPWYRSPTPLPAWSPTPVTVTVEPVRLLRAWQTAFLAW